MAFTEDWADILTTQVDADSPINETLMKSIRSDLIHIKEALGQNYTLAPDHDHDGVNSKITIKPLVAAGNNNIPLISYPAYIDVTTYAKKSEIKCPFAGVLRIGWKVISPVGGANGYTKLYKNGVAQSTARIFLSGGTYIETHDLSVNFGDSIEIWGQHNVFEPDTTTCEFSFLGTSGVEWISQILPVAI